MPSSDSYLIVGGGLLGGHIVDLLLQRGEKAVAVFDLRPSSFDSTVKLYQGDIADPDAVGKAIKDSKITCIIQTAAALPGQPRFVHIKVNIEGTKNVIEQAQKHGVRKFVWTSSASVVFDGCDQDGVDETYPYPVHPVDDYSETKATAEQLVLAANGQKRLSTCSLRVAGLFGPRDRLAVPQWMNIYVTGRTRMQLGSGHNLFDWTYIKNAAWAHLLAADRLDDSHPKHAQVAGQAFFVTNGEPRPFWEFPRALWRAAGWKETSPIVIPRPIAFLIAYISVFIAWLLGKEPTLTPFRVNVVTSVRWCNIDKARKALDYAPIVSLDDGIRETVGWWKTTRS